MAEIHPGVFLSNTDTDEWEFDPEVGGDLHVLCTEVGIDAGMSRFVGAMPSEPVVYTPPSRETLIVLEGEARVEIDRRSHAGATAGRARLDSRWHRNHVARHAAVQGVLGHRLTRWGALLPLEALDVQDRS